MCCMLVFYRLWSRNKRWTYPTATLQFIEPVLESSNRFWTSWRQSLPIGRRFETSTLIGFPESSRIFSTLFYELPRIHHFLARLGKIAENPTSLRHQSFSKRLPDSSDNSLHQVQQQNKISNETVIRRQCSRIFKISSMVPVNSIKLLQIRMAFMCQLLALFFTLAASYK